MLEQPELANPRPWAGPWTAAPYVGSLPWKEGERVGYSGDLSQSHALLDNSTLLECLNRDLAAEVDHLNDTGAMGIYTVELKRPLDIEPVVALYEQVGGDSLRTYGWGFGVEDWLVGGVHDNDVRNYVVCDNYWKDLDDGNSGYPLTFFYFRFEGEELTRTESWTQPARDDTDDAPAWWHDYLVCN